MVSMGVPVALPLYLWQVVAETGLSEDQTAILNVGNCSELLAGNSRFGHV
jgi:hypothetical protein